MTTAEAIKLIEESETQLRAVRVALLQNELSNAKDYFTIALQLLDKTCAIQLDTLT